VAQTTFSPLQPTLDMCVRGDVIRVIVIHVAMPRYRQEHGERCHRQQGLAGPDAAGFSFQETFPAGVLALWAAAFVVRAFIITIILVKELAKSRHGRNEI